MTQPKKTSTGNTYYPNTFQKPNVFADKLASLLPSTACVILDVVCRKIMGFEEHRRNLRDRIARSQLTQITGYSYNTIDSGLTILTQANILIPIGPRNNSGQEYELNLGQQGDYNWDYLNSITHKTGNPNPAAARAAARAKSLQTELLPPDMAGQRCQILTLSNFEGPHSDGIELYLNRGLDSISIEEQKPKPKDSQVDDPSLDLIIAACQISPRQLWQAALDELRLVASGTTYSAVASGTIAKAYSDRALTVAVNDPYLLAKLHGPLGATVRRLCQSISNMPTLALAFVHDPEPSSPQPAPAP